MKNPGKQPTDYLQAVLDTVTVDAVEREKMRQADDYYEGDQLTKEVLDRRAELGQPSPTVTLITEAVNSVLGQEIKRRTDTQVIGNTEEDDEIAEAINFELRQQEDVLDAEQIDSDAYQSMVVPGQGWVYVGESDNPFRRGTQIINVDREDVITDKRSERIDDSDCQWRCWRRFVQTDAAKMILPKHKGLIDQVGNGVLTGGPFAAGAYADTYLGQNYRSQFYRISGKHAEIAIYCVWYRSHAKRTLLVKGDDVQVYDSNNIEHVTALEDPDVLVESAHVPIMKECWFVGPYLVEEKDSPHPHNEFPLIEARGFMRRRDKRRYGLVEHAIGPQDEYNLLCTKIAEIIVSKRIFWETGVFGIGPDALKPEQVRDEFMRRDTMLEVQPGGLDKVRVEQDWAELERMVTLKEQAREQVRIAMGVNFSFTGELEGQQSGKAIASLAELSAATMGKINSNYEYYRKRRAWLMISHIIARIGQREHTVNVKQNDGKIKPIVLNQRTEYGVSNRLHLTKLRVKLKHIATSEGYKAYNHQRLTEMHNNTQDPALQQALAPAIIKNSDVPDADMIHTDYLKAIGKSDDPEAQKAAQEQQELERTLQQLEIDERRAEIEVKKAQAKKYLADAGGNAVNEHDPERQNAIRQLRANGAQHQLNRTLQ